MIDLTPLEVRQKKGDFRRAIRGYDPELVNDFLDLVADRMEELVKQNLALRESVEALRDELQEYRRKEAALSDALMTAQKLREDSRANAEKEAELIIREARSAAESARREASSALAREEESLRQVRARRSQLVQSFRRLLEREISELAVIEETLELEAGREVQRPKPGPAAASATSAGSGKRKRAGQDEGAREVAEGPDEAEAAAAEEDDAQEDWLSTLVEE